MEVKRKPSWLKANKLGSRKAREVTAFLRSHNLHTVCESAQCPNKGECFERGTATFMILGNVCTRNCTFCAIDKDKSKLQPVDINEPKHIAEVIDTLDLKYAVITTVTRDDLEDGGASQFARVIEEIRKLNKDIFIEVLISDLEGNESALETIIQARPDVINHNIETVPELYSQVRPMANYQRSLSVLQRVKEKDKEILTKSGLMLGLGETQEQVRKVMEDIKNIGVSILTLGQYMAPSGKHYPVKEYVHPDIFLLYKQEGEKMGIPLIISNPLVRSSYFAETARTLIKN